MAQADMKIVQGPYAVHTFEVASGAAAINAGEPVELVGGGHSSGAAAVNTVTAMATGNPIIGTDEFIGIANKAGTHTSSVAGNCEVAIPVPNFTRVRGNANSAAAMDTASELTNILFDVVSVDLTSSSYTLIQTATANTAPFRIEAGNIVKATLDCTVDVRAFRSDIS